MAEQPFTLTSPAFAETSIIPATHTCDGQNVSPELRWIHAPEQTRSFALVTDDPDAPGQTFTHWILFDIPQDAQRLPQGAAGIGTPGKNDFQQDGYGGPCPPPSHGDHRYRFRLMALDTPSLDLPAGASRHDVEQKASGHVLGEAMLVGRYRRQPGRASI